MNPIERFIDVGVKLHIREWPGDADKTPFLLVHGLSSNALTWNQVGEKLAEAGHPVVAVDQRGHGLSEKPDSGYDFATVTADLRDLIAALRWEKPVMVGQSWGGNVMLEFGARYPGVAQRFVFVDGGFLNLRQRGSWESIAVDLKPPDLNGTPRAQMKAWIRQSHPDWGETGWEATLGNFETMPDGTVRPWLTLARHLEILRAMYDQNPVALYPQVAEPVLICVADDGTAWTERKKEQLQLAEKGLRQVSVVWFIGAAHDIHVDQPAALVQNLLG